MEKRGDNDYGNDIRGWGGLYIAKNTTEERFKLGYIIIN